PGDLLRRHVELWQARAHERGPSPEDPLDLGSLALPELHELVVELHRRQGLDEEGRAARRAAVYDPAHGHGRIAPHGDDEPTVALGEEGVAQRVLLPRAVEDRLELLAQRPRGRLDARADAAELRARGVLEIARGRDATRDRPHDLAQVGKPVDAGGHEGPALVQALARRTDVLVHRG